MRLISGPALAISLLLAAPAAAAPTIETDDQKTVYAIGVTIASNLQGFNLTPAEIEIVLQGIKDGYGGTAKIDLAQFNAKVKQLAQQRAAALADVEKKESQGFLEKMAKEKGAKKTDSGLIFIPIQAGTGESPKATDNVKVHYEGKLRDGSVFDSSVQRGTPATFPLNRVIACWTEGLQLMKVGGKAKLICPSGIGYGDRGSPPKIKPGAALAFEVELLAIEPPTAPGAQPKGHP